LIEVGDGLVVIWKVRVTNTRLEVAHHGYS